jgi:hypothetical protein
VGVPLVAIGIAWSLTWAAGTRRADSIGDVVGALGLVIGAAVIFLGVRVFQSESSKDLSLWVGAMVRPAPKYPTFDFYIASIGHALVPWSAFAPFAFGRLFLPPIGRVGYVHTRESFGRMAILVAGAVVFAAHGFLAARTDLIAFTGPAIIAAACGVALRDFERGAHASVAVGVGTAVLCGLFHHDFHELPDKAYQAFAVSGPAFPESFKATALALWWVVLFGFAGVAFLTWVERDSDRTPFDPKNYMKILKALREEFDGLLTLGFFASVAGAAIAALFVVIGSRMHARWLPNMSAQIREGVTNAWWIIAFVPLGVILGILFACDLWLWAFNRSRRFSAASFKRGLEPFAPLLDRVRRGPAESPYDFASSALVLFLMALGLPIALFAILWQVAHVTPLLALAAALPSGVLLFLILGVVGDIVRHRAVGLVLGGAALGFVLCFAYYPALANQLSPKEVFESYQRIHTDDEPLALLGVGGRTAAYYAGGQPPSFSDVPSAYRWLAEAKGSRRYLAVQADQLGKLNQAYREHAEPRTNLPILDARSSQILLAASALKPGEKNENPLGRMVLDEPPDPQRKLDVNLDEKLQVLGIDIVDATGKRVESVTPNKTYHIKTYYRVLAPVTTEWEAFIHIDGFRRRHNGDHKVMNGKYPMHLWLPGDLLVDDYEFKLEPNFTPGNYTIFFGLFVGESRLKVKSGPSDGENRVNAGALHVL